ncbi:hypothetical protein HYS49_00800, partial [Candidatus Woesearchaeota archaeon]|nr:hypothetical protein [Candidatus Woesearchaeota archaeon]
MAKHHRKTQHRSMSRTHAAERREGKKAPEYMVQIADPQMLRKGILETLRDVIVFMQGYEQFIRVQQEKVAIFNSLKATTKELSVLIDGNLHRYFPKGELQPMKVGGPQEEMKLPPLPEEERGEEASRKEPEERLEKKPVERKPKSDLEQLESQLKDIEKQLQRIQ